MRHSTACRMEEMGALHVGTRGEAGLFTVYSAAELLEKVTKVLRCAVECGAGWGRAASGVARRVRSKE